MTLYDKIKEAVFREPRLTRDAMHERQADVAERVMREDRDMLAKLADSPVTREVGGVEVFNTYGEREEGSDGAVPAVVEAPAVGEEVVLEKATPRKQAHGKHGGALNVARAGSGDGDRINSLQTTVTAIQAVVATDPQQSRDLAHFARFANDAIRVHSGLVK